MAKKPYHSSNDDKSDLLYPNRKWITASLDAVADEAEAANVKADEAIRKANDAKSLAAAAIIEADAAYDAALDNANDAREKADAAHAMASAASRNADAAHTKADIAIDMATKSVRKLVLCFDGTGNQFSDKNSNVLHFFKCLKKDDENQLTYYQTGLGTYTHPTFITKPFIVTSKMIDEAIAWNFEHHVQDAYRFLMQNYKPGDKVSLFGFSRGAYTARVLCGFVQKVGLLSPENHRQIPFAWKVFKHSDDNGGLEKCAEYKKVFSLSVKFDFIGLWDTVASLGPRGKELPFAVPELGDIRVFRHALALDERRTTFKPNFKLTKNGPRSEPETYIRVHPFPNEIHNTNERFLDKQVREVWFAGCHCDVGGGSEANGTRNSLARISLRWMIDECFRAETDIIFDKDMLDDIGFGDEDFMAKKWSNRRPDSISASNKNKSVAARAWSTVINIFRRLGRVDDIEAGQVYACSEELAISSRNQYDPEEQPGHIEKAKHLTVNKIEEHKDALSDTHDQLSHNVAWWALELYPKQYRIQDSEGGNRDDFKRDFNLGKGREIYGDAWNTTKDQGELKWYIEVHESVRTRIEKYEGPKGERYRPLAWFKVPDANGGAPVSKFHWEGELEEMCTSKAGQMILWVK